MTNQVTLAQFRVMTPEQGVEIPVDRLRELRDEIKALKDDAADLGKRLGAILLRRYEGLGRATLRETGRDTGTATLAADGDKFKFDIPKKVEWDQKLLRQAVDKLADSGENVDEYVKITIEVSEAKYNAWPEKIKALFKDARTTKHGDVKVEFKD